MSGHAAGQDRVALSVLLFHAAMERNKSLSDFAQDLGIGAISLRQFILGKTQRPRQKTLDLMGKMLGLSLEDVRERMDLLPAPAGLFGEWMQDRMGSLDISRARLTRDTKISDGALRNYLSNRTLPDSDQAQRLAEVLEAAPLDVAKVVVANMAEAVGEAEEAGPGAADDGVAGEPSQGVAPELAAISGMAAGSSHDEEQLLGMWRQLHPQGRRATFSYIAMLLAER